MSFFSDFESRFHLRCQRGCLSRRVKDFEETEPRSNWAYLQDGPRNAIVVKGVTVDVRNPANQMVWEFNMVSGVTLRKLR